MAENVTGKKKKDNQISEEREDSTVELLVVPSPVD